MFHIFHDPSVLYDAKKIIHTNNNINDSKTYTYTLNIKVGKCYNKMEKELQKTTIKNLHSIFELYKLEKFAEVSSYSINKVNNYLIPCITHVVCNYLDIQDINIDISGFGDYYEKYCKAATICDIACVIL